MGTDRDEIARGRCPCGGGAITVDHCSPDHAWGGSSWLDVSLECTTCAKDYAITHNYNQVPKLVRKADIAKKEELSNKWQSAREAIEQSAEFKNLQSMIASALSTCRSMAAKFRFLKSVGLVHGSVENWRRKPHYHFSGNDALKVANALGVHSPNLQKMTAEMENRWNEAQIEIPAVRTGIKHLDM